MKYIKTFNRAHLSSNINLTFCLFFFLLSLLGATAVIIGLYVVLWGKSQELKSKLDPISATYPVKMPHEEINDQIDLEQPLLTNNSNNASNN